MSNSDNMTIIENEISDHHQQRNVDGQQANNSGSHINTQQPNNSTLTTIKQKPPIKPPVQGNQFIKSFSKSPNAIGKPASNGKDDIQSSPTAPEAEENANPLSQFDPIEVIQCISQMRPISIIYGKDRRHLGTNPSQTPNTNGTGTGSNSTSEVIHESEVPSLLRKHGDMGFQSLQKDNYKDALINLRKADIILNAYISNDGRVTEEILLYIKINLGICFYQIGLLQEAYTCFETCCITLKSKNFKKTANSNPGAANNNTTNSNNNGGYSQTGNFLSSIVDQQQNQYMQFVSLKMRKRRIQVMLYLQCCILLSELGQHEEGIMFGRMASQSSVDLLLDSIIIAYHIINQTCKAYIKAQAKMFFSAQSNNNRPLSKGRKKQSQSGDTEDVNNMANSKFFMWNDFYSPKDVKTNTIDQEDGVPVPPKTPNSNSYRNSYNSSNVQPNTANSSSTINKGIPPTNSNPLQINGVSNTNNSNNNNQASNSNINNLENNAENANILDQSQIASLNYCRKLIPILLEFYKQLGDLGKNFVSVKKEKMLNLMARNLNIYTNTIDLDYLPQDVNLDVLFNEIHPAHWIMKTNILGLLQLKPVSYNDIAKINDFESEVSSDNILLRLANVSVSFYCISTETRFIDEIKNQKKNGEQPVFSNPILQQNQQNQNNIEISQSENWLSRSLEIAYTFLPHEIPLVGQIISVHSQFHGLAKQIIPEDRQIDCSYSFVKTLRGGSKSTFFIPIIRQISNNNPTASANNGVGAGGGGSNFSTINHSFEEGPTPTHQTTAISGGNSLNLSGISSNNKQVVSKKGRRISTSRDRSFTGNPSGTPASTTATPPTVISPQTFLPSELNAPHFPLQHQFHQGQSSNSNSQFNSTNFNSSSNSASINSGSQHSNSNSNTNTINYQQKNKFFLPPHSTPGVPNIANTYNMRNFKDMKSTNPKEDATMFFIQKIYQNSGNFPSTATAAGSSQNSPHNTIQSSRNHFSAQRSHRTIDTATIYNSNQNTNFNFNGKMLNETISVVQGTTPQNNQSPQTSNSLDSQNRPPATASYNHRLGGAGVNSNNNGTPSFFVHNQSSHNNNNNSFSINPNNNNNPANSNTISNSIQSQGNTPLLPPSSASAAERKQLRQNFMDVDQILSQISENITKPTSARTQDRQGKQNLDIQINNNINFYINSDPLANGIIGEVKSAQNSINSPFESPLNASLSKPQKQGGQNFTPQYIGNTVIDFNQNTPSTATAKQNILTPNSQTQKLQLFRRYRPSVSKVPDQMVHSIDRSKETIERK